jgi:hypothetical protein
LLSVPVGVAWAAVIWQRTVHARTTADQKARIADRLAGVFAQLGSDQVTIRIAAVHTLEQIARDNPEQHGPIMQTLGAFVRECVPAPTGRYVGRRYEAPDPSQVFVPARTDVQAALTVLGRRARDHDRPMDRPVLSGINLSGYDLSDGDFTSANFRGSYLCGTTFSRTRLAAASFDYANLERADLFAADCTGASFAGAAAPGARFASGRLENAVLSDADLRGADFTGAQLDGANLSSAELDGAILGDAVALLAPPAAVPTLVFKSTNRSRA